MALWIFHLLIIGVTSFIGYLILLGVGNRQLAKLVLMVAVMLALLNTMQDLTPMLERWGDRADSLQNTADKLSGIGNGDWESPMDGSITQGYSTKNHGIDIGAPLGTHVIASKAGKVSRVEWNEVYGNYVVVDHGKGMETLYAHLQGIGVKVGWDITSKSRIGTCGSTGNSTGPHLHFEIRRNGKTVDPLPYLN